MDKKEIENRIWEIKKDWKNIGVWPTWLCKDVWKLILLLWRGRRK